MKSTTPLQLFAHSIRHSMIPNSVRPIQLTFSTRTFSHYLIRPSGNLGPSMNEAARSGKKKRADPSKT